MLKINVAALLAAGWTVAAFARVELATPFSDNMVLQRDRKVPIWGTADPGERISVSFAGTTVEATADAKGLWRVNLPAMSASKENRTLTAKSAANEVVVRNVLVGEVWFASGQSNMQCPIWGDDPRYRDGKGAMMLKMTRRPFIRYAKNPRVWSVRPEGRIDVVWREMTPEAAAKVTGRHLSAVAFYYALELYGALEVPVGVIDSTWGDTNIDAWTPRAAYAKHPALKDLADYPVTTDWKPEMRRGPINKPNQQPAVLWNGMVDAWAPFAIRGFIWYQGCHNSSDAYRYCEKMHALYDGWSAAFENPGLKLYFVELAPFREDWFKLQQAQHRFAAEEKNAAYVVTCDCGNQADVHPNDKEIVAKRLALHALKRDYGFADIEDCSPVLKDWKSDTNGVVTLAFDHADGWYYYNDDLSAPKGFDIAGPDGVFKPAKILNKAVNNGILVGRDLQIAADGVTKPRRIRYLANVPQVGSIYAANTSLPLGSFEIDARNPHDGRRGKLAKTGDALKIPELAGYREVFAVDVPVAGGVSASHVTLDKTAEAGTFARVAYALEIEDRFGYTDWAVTLMDAFDEDAKKLVLPTFSGAEFQCPVKSLTVRTNREGVKDLTDYDGGCVEIWDAYYGTANRASARGGDPKRYDWNDAPLPLAKNLKHGYGCLQVCDWKGKSVVFALNDFNDGVVDVGIGTNTDPQGHPDWTFARNGTDYKSIRLTVLVR